VDLRDEHLARPVAELAAAPADVVADRRLGDLSAMLVDQPPPDPLRAVALLARRVESTTSSDASSKGSSCASPAQRRPAPD
jgi:hypothetical protein